MITRKNILKHEFIGLWVEIIKSTNKAQIGLKGKIVDETKNTIKIETRKGEKIIQKNGTIFKIKFPRGSVVVNGNEINVRPEDRIRKNFKRWKYL